MYHHYLNDNYRELTHPDGSRSEFFNIYLKIGKYDYLEVHVENKITFSKRGKSSLKQESSILTIDDWELHRYDFLVPPGTDNLCLLEKSKGLIY